MKKIIDKIILSRIKRHFGFLFERGFHNTSIYYDYKNFGNWKASFQSDILLIEIFNDRGEINLVFSPISHDTNYLIEIRPMIFFLSGDKNFVGWINGNKDYQLEQLSNLLREYLYVIEPYFSINFEEYKDEMKKAQDVYNRKLRP